MALPTVEEQQSKRDLGRERRAPQPLPNFYSEQTAGETGDQSYGGGDVSADDAAATRRRLGRERLEAKQEQLKDAGQAAGGAVGGAIGARYAGPIGKYAGQKAGEEIGGKLAEKSTLSRWQKLKNAKSKATSEVNQAKAGAEAGTMATAAASQAANLAVQQGWMVAHEVVEETALSIVWILIVGPLALLLFLIRLFFAYIFPDLLTIHLKGVSVQLVPKLTAPEWLIRLAKNGIIFGILLIFVVLMVVIINYFNVKGVMDLLQVMWDYFFE